MFQPKIISAPRPRESLSILLQHLTSLCEDTAAPPLQMHVRCGSRIATLIIRVVTDDAHVPEATLDFVKEQQHPEPSKKQPLDLAQEIIRLLTETDRPLKSAAIALQLKGVPQSSVYKVLSRLLKESVICRPPKFGPRYWLTGRPLPSPA